MYGPQYLLAPLSFDKVMSEGSPAPTRVLQSPLFPSDFYCTPLPPPPASLCDAPPTVAQHQLSLSSALWAPAFFLCAKNTKRSPRSIVHRSYKHLPFLLLSFLSFVLPIFHLFLFFFLYVSPCSPSVFLSLHSFLQFSFLSKKLLSVSWCFIVSLRNECP